MALQLSSMFRGLRELFQGSSTAGQRASVPEESTTRFTDAFGPARNSYRESIRSVSVLCPDWRIRSTLSGQSGSNYDSRSSRASSSNNSGYSLGSASVCEVDLGTSELTKIARKMVSDGYTQRMVRELHSSSAITKATVNNPGSALNNWFTELDVDWILQLRPQLQLQKETAYWRQELVQRWIRAFTITVASIKEVMPVHEELDVARFGKASTSAMLVVVDTMLDVIKEDKLQIVLRMYMCVSSASYMIMMMMPVASLEAQRIFDEISASLKTEETRLVQAISSTMMDIRTDYCDLSWDIEIERSGGGIHIKIRFLVDCILSMRKACASTLNSAQSQNTVKLRDAIDETIDYLKDQLLSKSEWFSDPSLRCMFLLNNSYFVAQLLGVKLGPECEKYADLYLDFSWGHVLSCMPKSNFPGVLHRWINTSPLAKFKSAFHKTYQTQKFWKVPDPQLRDALRGAIIERVISGYREYLKEHPELAEQVSRGSNSPKVLEEMLGELFEG